MPSTNPAIVCSVIEIHNLIAQQLIKVRIWEFRSDEKEIDALRTASWTEGVIIETYLFSGGGY